MERDFGIPVSDSASVVSTGMASECSLQALHPVSLLPGRECFLSQVFFSSLPIPLLHHFFLSILGEVKRLPPLPRPFRSGRSREARPQFITRTSRWHWSCGAGYSTSFAWSALIGYCHHSTTPLGSGRAHWRPAVRSGPNLPLLFLFFNSVAKVSVHSGQGTGLHYPDKIKNVSGGGDRTPRERTL